MGKTKALWKETRREINKILVDVAEDLSKRRGIILYLSFAAGVFIAFFLGTYFYLSINGRENISENQNNPNEAQTDAEFHTPLPDSKDAYSILLMGRGGDGHSGGTLTDSNILVRVDTVNKKIALISIPRDLWVSFPTDYDNETSHKFNEAYAIGINNVAYANKRPEFRGLEGAGQLSKVAAATVTAVVPDYYVTIDFGSFEALVNELGSIDVESAVTWNDYFYPVAGLENETCGISAADIASFHAQYSGFQLEKQFECRYERVSFNKGLNSMDGETALKFVRSRHSGEYGGDFARSEKQFALLRAVANKLVSDEIFANGGKIVDSLMNFVNSDLTASGVKGLLGLVLDPAEYETTYIYLNDSNVLNASKSSAGAYILIPKAGQHDWSQVQSFIAGNL